MAPPIQLGIGLSLARAGGPGLDPDAAAYIAAVETAGATVTADQKNAINTFVKTGKSDGWYSSIKRLYLPIWGAAAPNAIDMVTRASGTFNGTVTHSAGYMKSDGATGYFDTNAIPENDGVTLESGHVWSLLYATSILPPQYSYYGGRPGSTSAWLSIAGSVFGAGGINSRICSGGNDYIEKSDIRGINIGSRITDSEVVISHRVSSGISSESFSTASDTLPSMRMFAMAASLNNTPSLFASSDVGFGGFGHGLGLTATQTEDFTLALKNLWETATGLTLP